MPLPDAPPTDQSRVYREFASKTALPGASGAITADLIDSFKNSLFLDEFSEDELRRLLLIQMVSGAGSLSGPMPDTSQISGVTGADSDQIVTVFDGTANVGEVWELIAADFRSNNSNTRAQLRIYVGSDEVEIGDETGHGGTEPFDPKGNFGPIWIDSNSILKAELTSMAAGREVEINAYLVRVR